MIVQPKIRGFICTTAHPVGCEQNIQQQIDYVQKNGNIESGPKKVLILGSSTGYGLASRVVAGFGCGAATIGVSFEKESDGKRTATGGWYHTVGFEKKAHEKGLYAKSFNGDAFSDQMKEEVIKTIKDDLGQVDLVIYSLAAPRRQHPKTGKISKSVLKPLNKSYTNKSIDMSRDKLEVVTLEAATEDEIEQTVAVMGGEDWQYWIEALLEADALSQGAKTVAYSYIGPKLTQSVYRQGTIGKAKDHLEATSKILDKKLADKLGGRAFISVNKALVTQSSSAIPFIPLYFILLKKVMVRKGLEEDCIAQIDRLFRTALYGDVDHSLDESGFIRMDDKEMLPEVQQEVEEAWEKLNEDNLSELADLDGYHKDFLNLFGFGFKDVNYDADVEIERPYPSAVSPKL